MRDWWFGTTPDIYGPREKIPDLSLGSFTNPEKKESKRIEVKYEKEHPILTANWCFLMLAISAFAMIPLQGVGFYPRQTRISGQYMCAAVLLVAIALSPVTGSRNCGKGAGVPLRVVRALMRRTFSHRKWKN